MSWISNHTYVTWEATADAIDSSCNIAPNFHNNFQNATYKWIDIVCLPSLKMNQQPQRHTVAQSALLQVQVLYSPV